MGADFVSRDYMVRVKYPVHLHTARTCSTMYSLECATLISGQRTR